eukprot:scaffold28399_cov63-Phaeocystis_antarctica.AAC.2
MGRSPCMRRSQSIRSCVLKPVQCRAGEEFRHVQRCLMHRTALSALTRASQSAVLTSFTKLPMKVASGVAMQQRQTPSSHSRWDSQRTPADRRPLGTPCATLRACLDSTGARMLTRCYLRLSSMSEATKYIRLFAPT